jgi:hypothetical protein
MASSRRKPGLKASCRWSKVVGTLDWRPVVGLACWGPTFRGSPFRSARAYRREAAARSPRLVAGTCPFLYLPKVLTSTTSGLKGSFPATWLRASTQSQVTMRKSYGFRTFRVLELALYHSTWQVAGSAVHPRFLTNRFFYVPAKSPECVHSAERE